MRKHRVHNSMIRVIRKMVICPVLACLCLTISFAESASTTQSDRIHCVTDISHEFTFYFDGRFGKNYMAVLSIAMERDLFPWFRALGITVDRSTAQIEIEF